MLLAVFLPYQSLSLYVSFDDERLIITVDFFQLLFLTGIGDLITPDTINYPTENPFLHPHQPLKCSGIRWSHLKLFNAIHV